MTKEDFCGPSGRIGASTIAAGVAAIDVADLLEQMARLLGRGAAREWLLNAMGEHIDHGVVERDSAR